MLKNDLNKSKSPRNSLNETEIVNQIRKEFEEFSRKRKKYIKFGFISIVAIPIFLMILMFSLESKIICLVLWVSSIILIAAVIIAIEYKDFKYKKLLGIKHTPEEEEEEEKNDEKNKENDEEKKDVKYVIKEIKDKKDNKDDMKGDKL